MAIGVTDAEHRAMFDTVTQWAFGPVFDSEEEARAFMKWADGQGIPDVRVLASRELEALWGRYASRAAEVTPDSRSIAAAALRAFAMRIAGEVPASLAVVDHAAELITEARRLTRDEGDTGS